MYARNANEIDPLWLSPDEEAEKRYYKFRDEHYDSLGPFRLKPLEATKSMDKRENLIFPIDAPDGTKVLPRRQWWWAKERVMRALAENKLSFARNSKGDWTISYKQYLRNETGEIRGSKAFSIFDGIYTQAGSADMQSLFGEERPFQFPKPKDLILKLLDLCTSPENSDIILDFFAGSGTTAHAVLDKNAQDSGNRKFILVQLPEITGHDVYPTIVDITRDRVKRVLDNLERNHEGELNASFRGGYKFFKLHSSNFELWDSRSAEGDVLKLNEQLKLFVSHVRLDRNNLGVLYEILLKSGLELTSDLYTHSLGDQTIFAVAGGLLMICLDELIQEETVNFIVKKTPRKFVCLDAAFHGHDVLKTNLKLIMQSHDIEFQTV